MCKISGHIVRWMFGGVLYGFLEVAWRGHTHWTMMLLAAVLCVPLDLANEHYPWELPLWAQAVLGGLCITGGELAAGLAVGWIGCMALDYLTGSMAAAKEGHWSSAKAREGIWHKCGMIVVVVVAARADLLIEIVLTNLPVPALPVQYPGLVCPVVLVWYIVTELGSMVENAAAMGAPVPGWLAKLLAASKDVVNSAGEKLGGARNE